MTPEEFKAWADRVADTVGPASVTGGLLILNAAGGWTWWAITPLVVMLVVTVIEFGRVDLDFS